MYYRDGLNPPEIVRHFKEESLIDSDPFAQFISEACEVDADCKYNELKEDDEKLAYAKKWSVRGTVLHDTYLEWDESDDAMTNSVFGKRVRKCKYIAKKTKTGVVYIGLRLKQA